MSFDDPQDFGLCQSGHVADFVEKYGSSICLLQFSRLTGLRSRERALFKSKQFAFEQRIRNRSAVHANDWLIGTKAQSMNRSRHQLFSRASLTRDENGAVCWSDSADEFPHPSHRIALSDKLAGWIFDEWGEGEHGGRLNRQPSHPRMLDAVC